MRAAALVLAAAVMVGACGACGGKDGSTSTTRPPNTPRKVDVDATLRAALPVLDRGPASSPEASDELLRACISVRRAADQASASVKAELQSAADECSSRPQDAATRIRAALGS